MMTKEQLITFESEIADLYCDGKIRAPVHLSDGNEEPLIEIFNDILAEDWVFSTWRSHYHALLHGISPEAVRAEILNGNSITLCFPEHRFFSSAIVGGVIPIALGVALGIKRKGEVRHVWCFIGDMTAEGGTFYEAAKYADNFALPITFVVEDNGESVGTPTGAVWGRSEEDLPDYLRWPRRNIRSYRYKKQWPHVGAGRWVTF